MSHIFHANVVRGWQHDGVLKRLELAHGGTVTNEGTPSSCQSTSPSSPVDCVPGNSTRSPGPCNATCGSEGKRTVRLTPVEKRPAKHGGKECKKEVKDEEEVCIGECGTTTGRRRLFGNVVCQNIFRFY